MLSLAVLLSTYADRMLALSLGASIVLMPPPETLGFNYGALFGPLIALALPLSLAAGGVFGRQRQHWLLIQLLWRALAAVALCLPSVKNFLAYNGQDTALLIAMVFLGSQLTLATALALLRQFTVRPLPYLAAASAAFFLAQGLAMSSQTVLLEPTGGLNNGLACASYLLASWLFINAFDILAGLKNREEFNRQALAIAEAMPQQELSQAGALKWWQIARYLMATAVLFMPLFAPPFAAFLFIVATMFPLATHGIELFSLTNSSSARLKS